MVERESLEQFRLANAELSRLVRAELEDFFRSLNLARPEAVRDALLEFVPVLTDQYGSVAASLAADFYEDLRAASGAVGRFTATTATSVPVGAVEANVRHLAAHLWSDDPAAMLSGLLTSADKYVKQPGRDTIVQNAKREGVRWARVPTGKKTCAFCLMLASRDAVFLSEKSAKFDKSGEKYHGDCDCQPVRIAKASDYPEGYLPENYYEMYKAARKDAGSGDIRDIASSMRRMYPDDVTDGAGVARVKIAAPKPLKATFGKTVSDPRGRRQSPLGYSNGKPLSDDIYNETPSARADSDFRFIDASTDKGADDRATGALQYFMETEKAAKVAARNLASGRAALDGVDLSDASFLLTDGYSKEDLSADIMAAGSKLSQWDANRVPLGKVYKGIQFDQGSTIEDVRKGLLTDGLNFTSVTPDLDLAQKYAGRPWKTRSVVLEIDGATGIRLNSVGDHAIKTESLFSGDLEILDISEVDDRFIVKARAK